MPVPLTENGCWECNGCGSQEYTGSVSEEDIEDERFACGNCGSVEFHWVDKP